MKYYLYLLFLSILCLTLNNRKISVFFLLFFAFIFSAFRFDAGYDFPVYYLYSAGLIKKEFEIIPETLVFISEALSPQLFFFATAFILIFSVYKLYQLINDKAGCSRVAIFIFLFSPIGFLDSLGNVRQFNSTYIFLYAIMLAYLSFYKKTFLFFIVSSLFHKSTLIFSPIFFISKKLTKNLGYFVYIIVVFFSYFFGPSIIFYASKLLGLYSDYFVLYQSDNGQKTYYILLIFFIWFLINLKIINSNPIRMLMFNLFFIGLCFYSAAFPYGMHIARISWSFIAIYPFLIGSIIINKNPLYRLIFVVFSIAMLFSALFFSMKNENRDFLNNYLPFFFLDQNESESKMKEEYIKSF